MTTAQDLLRKTYISVDVNDPVSKLLGKMKRTGKHYAVIFSGNTYKGVIGRRFLLTSRIDPAKMKVGNAIKRPSKAKAPVNVPKLSPDMDVKEICRLMAAADTHLLPVIKNKKVIGVVTADDLIHAIADDLSSYTCEELATIPAETVVATDEIGKAIQKFNWDRIDHLPVVDKTGKLIGIITLADILNHPHLWDSRHLRIPSAASHQGRKLSGYDVGEKTQMVRLPVENWMTTAIMCCTAPKTTIPDAINAMNRYGVSSIIITRLQKPVGILTIKDILKTYVRPRPR